MEDLTFFQDSGMIDRATFVERSIEYIQKVKIIKTNKKQEFFNVPSGFDIETSSFYENGIKSPENARAIMYHWQFGIGPYVTHGREWSEYHNLITVISRLLGLNEDRRLIVYVHNLPFEFFFIHKQLRLKKVFFLDTKKPVYAITDQGIEYRCSLKLSGGASLKHVGENLLKYPVEKMVGDLDYKLIRTPKTVLTEKELKYCENDIRVITSYIQEKIEQDGDITKIPLTNTGYVRKAEKSSCLGKRNWTKYHNFIQSLALTPESYTAVHSAFQGGYTHANFRYVGKVISDVHSYDFTSSYPSCMLLEKFPMSEGKYFTGQLTEKQFRIMLLQYNCIFTFEAWDIVPAIHQDYLISVSKCSICEGPFESNGRIISARHIKTVITEQDFAAYEIFYKWNRWAISDLYYFEKAYLPKPFVEPIIRFYEKKTSLKGIESAIVDYMISKNMLNACYGMTVTDIVRDQFEYDPDLIDTKTIASVATEIEKYNKNIQRFLYYPWGVYVTAYARANLWSGVLALGQDYIYSDTDSLKFINLDKHKDYFDRYNQQILEKIQKSADHYRWASERYSPMNKDGEKFTIGIWDYEGKFDRFKTLGAKRYLWERFNMYPFYKKKFLDKGQKIPDEVILDESGNQWQLTVAGTNKYKTCKYLVESDDPFNTFDINLIVPKDYSGRICLTYSNQHIEGDVVDYQGNPYHYSEESFVHMENTEYSFKISDKFDMLLKGYREYNDG